MVVTGLLLQPELDSGGVSLIAVNPADVSTLVAGPRVDVRPTRHLRMVASVDSRQPLNEVASAFANSVRAVYGPAVIIQLDDDGNPVSFTSIEDRVLFELLDRLLSTLACDAIERVDAVKPAGCICFWVVRGSSTNVARAYTHQDCVIHGASRN